MKLSWLPRLGSSLASLSWATLAHADPSDALDLTGDWAGIAALGVFVLAYLLVLGERALDLRRSKPLVVASGVIWLLVALAFSMHGDGYTAARAARAHLLAFTELFLFVLVMLIYVNAMEERGLFAVLREQLVTSSSSLRALYWFTGIVAFSIAPLAGNLPTAIVMASMVLALAGDERRFVGVGCIHVVVATNAGGVCSPFGDLTTLVAWQRHAVGFHELFALVGPALVAWLVPAAIMSVAVPAHGMAARQERVVLGRGAYYVLGLFTLTLTMAWAAQELLHLPAVLGMMSGLGLLTLLGYQLKRRDQKFRSDEEVDLAATALDLDRVLREDALARRQPFDVFVEMQRVDWDTLLFCYGAVLCVGGLATLGYAALGATTLYADLGPTPASVLLGLACAAIDQLVVMLSLLEMSPDIGPKDWLFATLALGLGGSLLPIGSVAGIAALRRARGMYTFGLHLKWSWAIALGYAAGLGVYVLSNGDQLG